LHLLNGECPFESTGAGDIKIEGVPNIITEQELHDEEFVAQNYRYLNMMKDLTKT